MRIGIGVSDHPDAAKAVASAARDAKKGFPDPDMVVVFASILYDQKKLNAALNKEFDCSKLLGVTSYAEITPAGVSKHSVAILLVKMPGARIRFGQADLEAKPSKAGLELASRVGGKGARIGRSVGLLVSNVVSGYENLMLQSLTSVLGPVPVFGAMACGNYDLGLKHPDFWLNYQYAAGGLTRRAAKLALLELPTKDYSVAFASEHGWDPIGPMVTLTRCKQDKVYEVEGQPVFDYYRQFLGQGHSDNFFEHMIQRYAFSMAADEAGVRSLLKLPVACDFKKGCISYFPAEDLQGRKVQLIQSNRRGLLLGAKAAAERCLKELGGMDPALVLVVSCCTRNAILHSNMDREVDAIREVFGKKVPVFGCYSGGEIAPLLSRYEEVIESSSSLSGSFYHTTTVGLMAIGSRVRPRVAMPARRAERERGSEAQLTRIKAQLANSEEILDSTESFLTNMSRKSYMDGDLLRKQNEVIHRYTPHYVWDQIGANVARGQYELPEAEFRGCFLFMDVKGFTTYSEEHKPSEVVAALNEIFAPTTRIIYDCRGDVDKYIGDCIFAAFAKPEDAVEAGARILELIARMREKGSPFSMRIGINYGRAVRANVGGADRREYTYIGDAVNTAQRLEAAGNPGSLVVSSDLLKQVKARFRKITRKEIMVKGKKKSLVVYECCL